MLIRHTDGQRCYNLGGLSAKNGRVMRVSCRTGYLCSKTLTVKRSHIPSPPLENTLLPGSLLGPLTAVLKHSKVHRLLGRGREGRQRSQMSKKITMMIRITCDLGYRALTKDLRCAASSVCYHLFNPHSNAMKYGKDSK